MGTHLRKLSKSFPMNTNMIGFGWFSKMFVLWTKVASALEGLSISFSIPWGRSAGPLSCHYHAQHVWRERKLLAVDHCYFPLVRDIKQKHTSFVYDKRSILNQASLTTTSLLHDCTALCIYLRQNKHQKVVHSKQGILYCFYYSFLCLCLMK